MLIEVSGDYEFCNCLDKNMKGRSAGISCSGKYNMIEVRNLKKTYKPKKGIKVHALDGINLKFEDKGLVFILGKSGSGKSTLLNMLGGLDNFDEGEIIIKGKSSKDFSQSDFDSYRNTFIGFIFQEYNILNDFTVGANIALAMELQGHKADNETLNAILKEVDLTGYAGRKPNELSGGQKQRVAIARALIKNPQIIMADEPTGALDSNTGKQVFDTLKRLSEDKLVIVVSHDRDFAEQYGDRVIELADGKIISDIKKYKAEAKSISSGIDIIDEKIIHIKPGYQLSKEDLTLINDYLKKNGESGSFISMDGKTNTEIRKYARIDEEGNKESFAETSEENLDIKEYAASDFKMIKSRLPFKNSLKMAAGSLKKKPFRLFMTILLSMVAFVLFGLSHTMISYERLKSNVDSIIDTGVDYVSFVKEEKRTNGNYSYYSMENLSDEDINKIKDRFPDKTFFTVYLPTSVSDGISFRGNLFDTQEIDEAGYYSYYTTFFTGIASIHSSDIEKLGYTLEGRMAEHENEIVITEYAAETFQRAGYLEGDDDNKTEVKESSALIGKVLTLNLGIGDRDYIITGIINTGFDSERYEKYKEPLEAGISIGDYMLVSELADVTQYSYHAILFVDENNYQNIMDNTRYFDTNGNDYGLYMVYSQEEEELSASGMIYDGGIPESDKQNIILFSEDKDINSLTLTDEELIIPATALANDEILYAKLLEAQSDEQRAAIIKDNKEAITSKNITMYLWSSVLDDTDVSYTPKIVGVYNDIETKRNAVILSKSVFNKLGINENAKYKTILSDMPSKRSEVTDIVRYSIQSDDGTEKYVLMNSVSSMLDTVSSVIRTASKVFLVVGIIFAVFASIMLMNFIATSIANKKREIGILRAVGARGADVFRIFFHESLMIALINWMVSIIATGLVVTFINHTIRNEYKLLVTILHFGFIQIAVMLLISAGVAFVASFLPIYRVSRKKPIEAIRKS